MKNLISKNKTDLEQIAFIDEYWDGYENLNNYEIKKYYKLKKLHSFQY